MSMETKVAMAKEIAVATDTDDNVCVYVYKNAMFNP